MPIWGNKMVFGPTFVHGMLWLAQGTNNLMPIID